MSTAALPLSSRQATTYAYFVLAMLTLLNLLNYIDRYIFSALVPYIKADTGYTDAQLGLIGSAFTWVYTLCSPLFGYLGDRYHRGRLIAVGIFVWSLATAGAGLARSLWQLLVARAAVGVGEANYATIAPSLLADYFPKARRGLAMSIFQATIPIGAAAGFVLGGYLGAPDTFGWRYALLIVGVPGLLAAFTMVFIREPQRGIMDEPPVQPGPPLPDAPSQPATVGWLEGYRRLLVNRGYLLTCLGYAAVTFALGALVFWAPEWMKADKGLSEKEANLVLGICAVVGDAGESHRRPARRCPQPAVARCTRLLSRLRRQCWLGECADVHSTGGYNAACLSGLYIYHAASGVSGKWPGQHAGRQSRRAQPAHDGNRLSGGGHSRFWRWHFTGTGGVDFDPSAGTGTGGAVTAGFCRHPGHTLRVVTGGPDPFGRPAADAGGAGGCRPAVRAGHHHPGSHQGQPRLAGLAACVG